MKKFVWQMIGGLVVAATMNSVQANTSEFPLDAAPKRRSEEHTSELQSH